MRVHGRSAAPGGAAATGRRLRLAPLPTIYTEAVMTDVPATQTTVVPAIISALPQVPRGGRKLANLIAIVAIAVATVIVIVIVVVAVTLS